ncbi:hypothetical protein F7725_021345, partial [Dissostichus mawsoni]
MMHERKLFSLIGQNGTDKKKQKKRVKVRAFIRTFFSFFFCFVVVVEGVLQREFPFSSSSSSSWPVGGAAGYEASCSVSSSSSGCSSGSSRPCLSSPLIVGLLDDFRSSPPDQAHLAEDAEDVSLTQRPRVFVFAGTRPPLVVGGHLLGVVFSGLAPLSDQGAGDGRRHLPENQRNKPLRTLASS